MSRYRFGWQVHAPVAPQLSPIESRHTRLEQQGLPPPVQVWPMLMQLDIWQVPVPVDGLMVQPSPLQQSEGVVHRPPSGWHTIGGEHTPPVQIIEQHWLDAVQAAPFAVQLPASVGARHAPLVQSEPGQHWPLPLHAPPRPVHIGTSHTATPLELGTHSAPLQH